MGSDLQQARYDRLVRRVGGIIGPGSKVTEALSELFPILDMENMPHELLVLAKTQTVFSTLIRLGVAAEFSKAQLFNPADSGNIVIPTSVYLSGSSTGVAWTIDETQISAPGFSGKFRDSRSGLALESAGKVSSETNAALIPQFGRIDTPVTDTFHLFDSDGIAVLAPGTGIVFSAVTANTALIATFFWRERTALSSELNF